MLKQVMMVTLPAGQMTREEIAACFGRRAGVAKRNVSCASMLATRFGNIAMALSEFAPTASTFRYCGHFGFAVGFHEIRWSNVSR